MQNNESKHASLTNEYHTVPWMEWLSP